MQTDSKFKHGIYKHYKGGVYATVCLARHTETGETLVVYYPIDAAFNEESVKYARPLDVFTEYVTNAAGKLVKRFEPQ